MALCVASWNAVTIRSQASPIGIGDPAPDDISWDVLRYHLLRPMPNDYIDSGHPHYTEWRALCSLASRFTSDWDSGKIDALALAEMLRGLPHSQDEQTNDGE